ncbi:HpcH/HpaI aldolase/citrate lyase family protein [Hydrogenophaga sp.]|uniref:HpcH/HpaI aldolase family protein n=1 Tax=Hydrogenophaga sp. TaxID=1904254 RepID=UPI00271D48FA|nr:aldolase/citrate lyase family protein [Hydrogenophaga sp.]MDO9439194.1 aldolase/citrate lyase family protein [Hydrogenophaga sp.]
MDHTDRHPLDVRLPAILRNGSRVRGIFTALPSPGLIEMCGYAGFEFVIIDNEHGAADFSTTEHLLRAARASGIVPVVRCLPHDIPRVLDMGASGVMVPMCNTPTMAAALARQIRYPGVGQRGSAFSPRAAGYGAFGGNGHTARSNDGVVFMPMIETPEGVENATAIAATPGVDAVFVGPNDLSHSMGQGDNWRHPDVDAAIGRALRAVADAGKPAGTLGLSPEDEVHFGAMGATFFANVATALITRVLRQAAQGEPASGPVKY